MDLEEFDRMVTALEGVRRGDTGGLAHCATADPDAVEDAVVAAWHLQTGHD